MFLCLRVDLDYVPWDTPDAAEFGHGEPAAFLRLLDLARTCGYRFHFFASERVMRAFPATAEAVLNEGHDLDWFCKHPESVERKRQALDLLAGIGHRPAGLAVKGNWPPEGSPEVLEGFGFISSGPGSTPGGIRHFPVETRAAREAFRSGTSLRTWTDSLKSQLRDFASRNMSLTIVVRPQVLAKYDPKLALLKEVLELADAVGLEIKTLRQALND
ncbi:MAG TPA: hypothetical protein VG820_00485 [Fimbriimonadaceae bacterium]|nr:hypothetical protein [Fimbriimonadaceae bacterium]